MPCDLRQMTVAVDDQVAVGEPACQPLVASCRGTGVVDDADPPAFTLDDRPRREPLAQRGVVHVAVDGRDRGNSHQVVEDLNGREVSRMDDERRLAEDAAAVLRQATRSAGQMGIGDERDQNRSPRNRPSR